MRLTDTHTIVAGFTGKLDVAPDAELISSENHLPCPDLHLFVRFLREKIAVFFTTRCGQ
jgi:hypothetical protein